MAEGKILSVDIVTPGKTLFSGEAISVSVPGRKSPFQVLYNHAPIVSTLDAGNVKVVSAGGETMIFRINDGLVEVRKNKISILTESADDSSTK